MNSDKPISKKHFPKFSAIITMVSYHSNMERAISEARRCKSVESAYNVGCVIQTTGNSDFPIFVGYSREIEGNTHAEQVALQKLEKHLSETNTSPLRLSLYTTMEPCSKRLSGNKSCTNRIMEFNIKYQGKVFIETIIIGTKEPSNFVHCEGIKILEENGLKIEYENNLTLLDEISKLNSHLTT
eukprot:snap_masked-scaffold_13-processed-gene-10.25-mRNA-1 protein AED:0.08 eAED:0.16 QI:0/0/0/0.5/1/1/2/0/183